MKKTSRGFYIYSEFTDLYRTKISIHESSLATQPAVWIEHSNLEDGKMVVGYDKPFFMTPHLSVAQAKRVIKALQKFVDQNEPKEVTLSM